MQVKLLITLVSILFLAGASHSQTYIMSNSNQDTGCSGTLYDSGGAAGDYGNGANLTYTICPSTPGSQLQLNFTAFNIEDGYDFLTIYNGSGITGPTLGTYTGLAGPGLVQASNASGCITLVFTSDGSVTSTGWAATISCTSPCQTIVPNVTASQPISGGTYIDVCQGDVVTFTGTGTYPQNNMSYAQSDATSTFNWTFSDGGSPTGQIVNHTYNTPGIYQVDLQITDVNGCVSTIDVDILVRVSDDPSFVGSLVTNPVICLGDINTLTGAVTPTEISLDCTPPVAGTTFLPDGSGVSYSTDITVDCFAAGQLVTSAADIDEICITMEHSYLGDLELEIECPNGQTATLHAYPGGNGTYLGAPNDPGPGGPGTGWEYCFDMGAASLLVNGGLTPAGNPVGNAITAGSYLPVDNFTNLIGCPLNGDWTINITDNLASDDGYIFGWNMGFNQTLTPPATTYTPAVVSEGWQADPTITATAGNTITVQPVVAGVSCYTYEMTDEFGCNYDTTICFTVLPPTDPGCPNCFISTFNASVGPCEAATNSFTVTGDFTFQDNPGAGNLVVEVTNGSGTYSQTFTPPFTDGQLYNYSISGVPSDGTALTVTVYFVNDPACTAVINSTSPASCACNVDIGTFSVATTGTQTGNDFVLCFGDDLDITANGDFSPAAEATNPPGPPYSPGIAWLVYSCPPTVALAPDPVLTIPDDPCLLGIVGATNLNETNDMFWINAYPPGTFTNNTVYFVPVTIYSTTSTPQIYSYTNTTMPCYETGPIYSVQYIPEITEVSVEDCAAGTVTTTVTGGQPSMDGSSFTGTNLVPATASFAPGTATNGGNIVVTGLVDGDVYSYDIVDDSGCPITVTGTFVGLEDPAFSYPQTAYCQDDANPSPVVTGDAGGTFSSTAGLSINPITGLVNLAASTPGTYTVTYQTPDPVCFATSTFDITVNPLPIVDGNDETICTGASVTLNGTGADTYVWNNGVVDGVAFSPAATTTYTVTGTITATGCSNTGTATVTIDPLDDPSFTTTDYCAGGVNPAPVVTGLAGGTFAFNPVPMGPTIDPTTGVISGGVGGNTYTIEYTTNGPCPQSSTQTVTVNDLPPVDAQDVSICVGGTATITATGAVTYSWDNGVGAGQTHNVTPAANTVYTVTGTDANGCVNTDLMTVSVLANAPIDAGVDVTICDGDMVTLTATGGVSYTWGAPISAAGASQNVSPSATTVYTVDGTDANGCTGTDMVTVNVDPLPTATVAGTVTLCQNDPDPTITFTGANGTAPYTFTYNINGGASQTVTSVGNTATVTAPTGVVGTFDYNLVSVSDGNASPCTQAQVDQATVTINPTPTATVAGTVTVCQNGVAPTITFTGADGTAPYTFTYNINGGANQTVTSVGNTATVTAPTGTVGTFDYNLVSVSDGSVTGCSQAQAGTATVTVNALPTAVIAGTTSVCEGGAGPIVTFTGANGVAPYTFTYNINGGANQTVSSGMGATAAVTAPTGTVGTFNYNLVSVTEGSSNGCAQAQAGTATITVNANPTPIINGATQYCTGTTSTLSTTIPYASYVWSTGSVNPTVNVTDADNPITVTVTNAQGCSATSAIFTVQENNVIVYTSTVDICQGASATIHGNSESVAGLYSQTFILPTGCDSTSEVTLNVLPLPVINAGLDQVLCSTSPITLSASGAPNIAWDNGVVNGVPFNQGVGTTTYTATGTDAFGCIGTDDVDVTINPLPTATIAGTVTVCQNDVAPTITFTGANGTAPYTFTYNINNGANQTVTSVGNTATVTAPTGIVGTFDYNLVSVMEGSALGCSQAQVGQATVTVNDLPTATVAGTITVCEGDAAPTITFTGANGTAPYTFTYNINGGASQTVTSVGNTATVTAPTGVSGTFNYNLVSVSEGSANGCSQAQVDVATVTVNPLPTATVAGTVTVCQNDVGPTITFTGANGTAPYTFTYNINGGANQTVVSVGATATVTAPTGVVGTFDYNLISVSDASVSSCSQAQVDQATVTVVPNPTATVDGTVSVCLGDADPTITFTGANGTAPYTFTYNVNNTGDVTVVSVGNTATITIPTMVAGTFNINLVGVSDASGSGCTQAQAGTATVTVNDLPVVSAGNDLTICEGDQTALTGSGAVSYVWDQGVSNGVLFTPAATNTYTVTGTDANGCVNTDDVTITLEPAPVVSFVGDVLSGCEPLEVTFTNTTPGNLDNCVWTLGNGAVLTGCGSVTTIFDTPGTYDVTLTTTSTTGCTASATYTDYIYVEGIPNASFTPSSSLISNLNSEVYFENTSTGAVSYEWDFGDVSSGSTDFSPIHIYPIDASGTYVVELIALSPLGCADTAYAEIELIEEVIFYVPNTFTPDDDDYNPTFQPVFSSGYDPYDFTLLIFNRWGEIIFESHNADIGWDGTYGGKLMQDGTYTWKIEFKTTSSDERRVVVGHVNMMK